jgi:hypothetical protein
MNASDGCSPPRLVLFTYRVWHPVFREFVTIDCPAVDQAAALQSAVRFLKPQNARFRRLGLKIRIAVPSHPAFLQPENYANDEQPGGGPGCSRLQPSMPVELPMTKTTVSIAEGHDMAKRQIEIPSVRDDGQIYEATFQPVRKSRFSVLGWASFEADGTSFRFPVILKPIANRRGYTVYTPWDWQAPASTWGDLSDPEDWGTLTKTGAGRFINPRLRNAQPISLADLALPLAPEQG